MSIFNIAYKNLKQNFNDYLVYFVSMVFSIIMYYTFVTIQYNDAVQNAMGTSLKINSIFYASSIVMLVFCIIFIWVSNNFFTRKRKKEMALYSLLGVKKRQIGNMFFYETLLMGIIALFLGVLLGSILSNLFTSILIKIMGLSSVSIPFKIIPKAIIQTTITFFIIFFVTSIHSASIIYKNKLIDLFKGDEVAETEPKSNIFIAISSIVIIGFGYSLVFGDRLSALSIPATVLLTIIGTYGLFSTSLVSILKLKKKNKSSYFKGLNMISNSQLLYRIKGNSRTLSTIAILSATTLTAVGSTYGFYYKSESIIRSQSPYSLSFISSNKALYEKVDNVIKKYPNNKTKEKIEVNILKQPLTSSKNQNRDAFIVKESDYLKLIKPLNYENKLSLTSENHANLILFGTEDQNNNFISSNDKEIEKKLGIKVNKTLFKNPLNPERIREFYVIKDSLFNKLSTKDNTLTVVNYLLNNDTKMKELSTEIDKLFSSYMIENNIKKNSNTINESYSNFYTDFEEVTKVTGIFLFIGALLGLIFLICTGSIIFFKQLSEATNNKTDYDILKKIGVNNLEIKKSVSKQLLFVFAPPLMVGICHGTAAIASASSLFKMNLLIPALIIFGIYSLIYMIYYIITVNSYYKIVSSN